MPLTFTLRSGAWATMPPEERLSLNSGPPEVSVVLPTGQDEGWTTGPSPKDSEVWYVTTGRRSEPRGHLCLLELTREEPYFPLTRKTFPTPSPQLLPSPHVIP